MKKRTLSVLLAASMAASMAKGNTIIENAAKAGLPVPARLKDTLEQLTNKKEERK